jgi:hypothetical protein
MHERGSYRAPHMSPGATSRLLTVGSQARTLYEIQCIHEVTDGAAGK